MFGTSDVIFSTFFIMFSTFDIMFSRFNIICSTLCNTFSSPAFFIFSRLFIMFSKSICIIFGSFNFMFSGCIHYDDVVKVGKSITEIVGKKRTRIFLTDVLFMNTFTWLNENERNGSSFKSVWFTFPSWHFSPGKLITPDFICKLSLQDFTY